MDQALLPQFERLHASAQHELADALAMLRSAQLEAARLTEERDRLAEQLRVLRSDPRSTSGPSGRTARLKRLVRRVFPAR